MTRFSSISQVIAGLTVFGGFLSAHSPLSPAEAAECPPGDRKPGGPTPGCQPKLLAPGSVHRMYENPEL